MASVTADDRKSGRMPFLVLATLGVVYGDIGTSPLYTIRECFGAMTGLPLREDTILGILSLIFWALMIVVTIKYILLVLRADNRGEGGVLALMALALRQPGIVNGTRRMIIIIGLLGTSLFYGDGVITPAISVLGAVEGLKVYEPELGPYTLVISTAILLALFIAQRGGTNKVGVAFGPVMCVWFLTIAVLGGINIARAPAVLWAINPLHAVTFFITYKWQGFAAIGAVLLAVTGAEALYADMGHLGRKPIQVAWLGFVLPSLLLNYFGQGALLLHNPTAIANPFFLLVPEWGQYPLLILSILAAIIASQAVISGAFSLTRQAIQLGYLPRMSVRHTSESEIGQVYVPAVNWALMLAVIIVVLGFGESSELASAYGIAVTAEMILTTFLAIIVFGGAEMGHLRYLRIGLSFLISIDLTLFSSTVLKITDGGWFTLLIAATMLTIMITWKRGREVLTDRIYREALPIRQFVNNLRDNNLTRVKNTAVFMTSNPDVTPSALLHNLKHNQVLHERVILMTIITETVPRVLRKQKVVIHDYGKGFYGVTANFGFMERPNVPHILKLCGAYGLEFEMMKTSFFLSRETLVPSRRNDLSPWQERLFIALSHFALSATRFFGLPPGRVVEMGTQIEV
ncbi:MAG: potassium transporter Kup [Alphaproteobacteria bacterium]